MSLLFPSRTITIDAALRDLAKGSAKSRVTAAQALGDVGPADRSRVRPALIAALEDNDPAVRAEAAASLGEAGAGEGTEAPDDDAVAALIRRLDDGHGAVRQGAAIALGTLRAAAAFSPLVAALTDGPVDLRFQAATSLVEIDALAAFAPLAAAAGDPDAQVVAAVALALGGTGDARAPALIARLLEHADAGVRFDAAYALAQLDDRRGLAALIDGLGDSGRDWDAVLALERVGDAASAPALAAVIGRRGSSPEVQARAAGAALALAPDGPDAARARAHLLEAMTSRRLTVRGVAIDELAKVGGDWAVAPLTVLATRRRGKEVADAISAALGRIALRRGAAP